MLILGAIILILGGGLAVHGLSLNQNFEAQLNAIFENGATNPGNVWLIIGIIVAVLGIAAIVFAILKKKYFKF